MTEKPLELKAKDDKEEGSRVSYGLYTWYNKLTVIAFIITGKKWAAFIAICALELCGNYIGDIHERRNSAKRI